MKNETLHIRLKANLRKSLTNIKTWLLACMFILLGFVVSQDANAVNNVAGGYVYFDNTKTGWTDACIQFVIGHSSFSRTYTMTKITNTNLYYVNLSSSTYHDWSDATYYAVIGTSSKWGDGDWGSSNLTNATHRTAAYTTKYDMDGDTKRHLIIPSTSSNETAISVVYQGTSYSDVNKKVTVYVYNAAAGSSTYSANSAAGTAKVSGYYLSGNSIAETRSASTTLNSTYTANNTIIPNITLIATATSGYKFVGWYSSTSTTTALSADATFPTSHEGSDKTYYARFEKLATITYNANGKTASNMPDEQTVESDYNVTLSSNIPTASGYTFTGWNTAANGTGTAYEKEAKLTNVKSNITLYAQWKVACTLPTSISIVGEEAPCANATNVEYTATVTGGSDYELVWTVPKGYTITSGEGTTSIKVIVGTASGDITCTAKCIESSTNASNTISINPVSVVTPTISIEPEIVCPNANTVITVGEAQLNKNYTYTLHKSSDNSQVGDAISNPTTGPVTFTISSPGTYYVKAQHQSCGAKNSEPKSFRNYSIPEEMPAYDVVQPTICNGKPNANGSITLKNTVGGITYKLKGEVETSWSGLVADTYTLTASLDACQGLTKSWEITLTAEDITPKVETFTMPADFSSCDGQLVQQGISLQGWEEEDGYTYTYQWQSSGNGTLFADMNGMTSSSMTPQLNNTTWYRVKVTKAKDGCTSPEKISNAVKVTALSKSAAGVAINSVTYNRTTKKISFTGTLTNTGCSQDVYVGYQYKLANSDTWDNDLVNIKRIQGNEAINGVTFDKSDITISGAASGQTYTFRAYAINGYPNYDESSAVYSSTIEVEVKDGYTVYVRRPKSGDGTGVYSNWYAWSSIKGGVLYVKSGAISGSDSNNQATTNNTGGVMMDEGFTDCEGNVWDSFVLASGQTQFHVHALNDGAHDGWATFSKTATVTANEDNYFYLSSWEKSQYGVTITKTDKPALDVRIAALGSTDVKSNNMASFAALYLSGNCSGKEIKTNSDGDPIGYQWKYSSNNGSTWSNYSGDGSTWNNIRPTAAGKYKLVCTFTDDSTMESNVITITNSTGSYTTTDLINIKSSLPIIMVNTGGKGFPSCVNSSDYPSRHAETLKAKRSVDVKIKLGDEIIYDKKARMNYRGSSSLNFKKKSYAFCPGADMCGTDKGADYVDTKKIDMLSLLTNGAKKSVKDKDWVLYAANPDPSMMRNILTMEAFSAMTGKWGVKSQYVELYIDGAYHGVYVFMDKVSQNKDGRVKIEWDVKDASKRGFILKFDKTDVVDRYEGNGDKKTFESKLKTGNTGVISYGAEVDQRFEIEYPEKEDIEDDGGSWNDVYGFIKGKVDAFEEALSKGDFATVRTLIDYESWADFFLINEFAKNADGYRASCIFVYEDNLLKAYPLWDYELSFDNEVRQEHGANSETGLLVKTTTYSKVSGDNGTFPCPFWWTGNYYNTKTYKGLLDDPCFVSMIKTRWDAHKVGALSASSLQTLINGYNKALTTTDATTTYNTPQKREEIRWPYTGAVRGTADCSGGATGYYGQGAGSASSEVETFSTSKTTLDAWIANTGRRFGDNESTGGLEAEINALAKDVEFAITAVADKTTTTPWRPVNITVNSNSSYDYSITPEPALIKENGNVYTIYVARPAGTEGKNFTTQINAYTFTATSGSQDQCGGNGDTAKATVNITLEDVEEICD